MNTCPACGDRAPLEIRYGLHVLGAEELTEEKDVAHGGCVITDDSPRWRCRIVTCATEWGTL